MTRYTLTVPLQDNAGNFRPDYVAEAERLLAKDFKSWTKLHGIGQWKSQKESVVVFQIDTPGDFSDSVLRHVARVLAHYCDQEAIYLTRQTIETFLIEKG
jgi:dissimilatory sulfite reductase (desulfoviridin) alpha/beta subunit